jgi:hypothetical protein
MATTEHLVSQWKAADAAYNRDCNLRWALHKPDAKRKRLRVAANRAFDRMMCAVRTELRTKIAVQSGTKPRLRDCRFPRSR